jgi:hypothetical protein
VPPTAARSTRLATSLPLTGGSSLIAASKSGEAFI